MEIRQVVNKVDSGSYGDVFALPTQNGHPTLYLLIYGHKHGEEHFLCDTEARAYEVADAIIAKYRDEYDEFEGLSPKEAWDLWNEVTEECFIVKPLHVINESPITIP